MIVPIPQFTVPAYNDRTLNNVQRMQNWFPEQTPDGWNLVGYPGYTLLATSGNNQPCRGAYYTSTGQLFSVNGNTVYTVDNTGTFTSRGTISTSAGEVSFADNGLQLLIVVRNTNAYTVGLLSGAPTLISDASFPSNPLGAAFKDGYFVVGKVGTGLFYLSQLLDGTDWTPQQFATAEYAGDYLSGIVRLGERLILLGTLTIEQWYNTGNASFPLERVSGATLNMGVGAEFSIATIMDSVFFIGTSQMGQFPIYQLGSGGVQKISTPQLEATLAGTQMIAWYGYCYSLGGHSFYVIRNTSEGGAYAYDITTKSWAEVVPIGTIDSIFQIVNASAINGSSATGNPGFAFDANNGRSYAVRANTNSANGTALSRIRIFGPISSNSKRVFHSQIRFELEMASDSTGITSIAPTLEWSDDGGLTWSTAITLTKTVTNTTTGQRVVLTANRLGSSAERFYRLTGPNSAAKFILKKCELDLREGRF